MSWTVRNLSPPLFYMYVNVRVCARHKVCMPLPDINVGCHLPPYFLRKNCLSLHVACHFGLCWLASKLWEPFLQSPALWVLGVRTRGLCSHDDQFPHRAVFWSLQSYLSTHKASVWYVTKPRAHGCAVHPSLRSRGMNMATSSGANDFCLSCFP